MLGVVKLVPVPNELPPVAAAYQLIVPADAVAPKVTVPGPQRVPGVVPVMVGLPIVIIVFAEIIGDAGSPDIPPYSTKYPLG